MRELLKKKIEIFCGPKYKKVRILTTFLFMLFQIIGILFLLNSPICVVPTEDYDYTLKASDTFDAFISYNIHVRSFSFVLLCGMALIIAGVIVVAVYLIKSLFMLQNEEKLLKASKISTIFSVIFVPTYTVFTYVFPHVNTLLGGISYPDTAIFPIVYTSFISILFAGYYAAISYNGMRIREQARPYDQEQITYYKKLRKKLFIIQCEYMAYVIANTVIAIIAMTSNIMQVKFETAGITLADLIISGKEYLFNTQSIGSTTERFLAFALFVAFLATLILMFLTLVSFISRSKFFNKFAFSSIITTTAACLMVGLFGQFYKIIQLLNKDLLDAALSQYGLTSADVLSYTIKSSSMIFIFIALALVSIIIIRRPYSKSEVILNQLENDIYSVVPYEENNDNADVSFSESNVAASSFNSSDISDPCPSFTELDLSTRAYVRALEEKRTALFEEPSLPKLVDFIVQYARDSRLHLSYTQESIATFLAGLGTSRLTILQGMSGTGKTSLPKIVAEALYSVCDIVEVESSWRDKNELLGYYNEFSRIYSPKKFTLALYRATLEPDAITFIVLDEMNLSRIEYYFSDFLSLMENEPDKRSLKLLNTSIFRNQNGKNVAYKSLMSGHTLKIPANVWFVGTANRDESTYDISDKVYDRAHTMNFSKRAKKPLYYGEPMKPRYISAQTLSTLFEEARSGLQINVEQHPTVVALEKLLSNYNISFGNRIAIQMESFVSIYAACFANTEAVVNDALDIILLSKVVRKLETKSVEDSEVLATELDGIGLSRCAQFVRSLKED